jgi:hypothetical protein
MIMKRIMFIVSGFLLTSWVLTSCSPKSSDTTPPATKLMLVHASANTPPLDFYVSNGYEDFKLVATNKTYQSTTGYLSATAGTYAVISDTADQNPANSFLTGQYIALNGGNGSSLFIIDSSASVVRGVHIGENLTKAAADSSGVRFFHFSPGAPSVDVFISSTTTPTFSNRAFLYLQSDNANAASTNFSRVLAGTYTISIREANTSNVLTTLQATFTGTKLYTLFISGFTTQTGEKALSARLITNE